MKEGGKTPKGPKLPDVSEGDAPDPVAAKKAFEAQLPEYRAIPDSEVKSTRPGLGAVALYVYGRSRELLQPSVRAKFALLPKQLFDIRILDRLPEIALGAWYAQMQLDSAEAVATEVRVSYETVSDATGVKDRMLLVAGYHLKHRRVELAMEIADIISGTGHADLASDLLRLQKLYLDERALLPQHEHDPHYRPGDAQKAGQLAKKILDELTAAQSKAVAEARNNAARAFTVLWNAWDAVSSAGQLAQKAEGGAKLFPSLFQVGRAAPVRRKANDTKAESAPAEGGTAAAGGEATPPAKRKRTARKRGR